ncbi:unnamed protein product [Periconia digitata]|uniref:Uncharacterized protein n=1 Tax=Periconia digitata TaxID=1303443 RepID=A0A9W4UMT1_9PLEO|nr:unnamed protein product [Periconia digitata]
MVAHGYVLDLLNDSYYADKQDVTGNVAPFPTLVPYDQYGHTPLVYRMNYNHAVFLGLIQDYTNRLSAQLGKELWTWCVQWKVVVPLNDPETPSTKKPRLDSMLQAANNHEQSASKPAYTNMGRRILRSDLFQNNELHRVLVDIVTVRSSLVPNYVEFLYQWIDYHMGDGTALHAAVKHEIPSLWLFEQHPRNLTNGSVEIDEGDLQAPTATIKESKDRMKPDIGALERQTQESERMQYHEVKFGLQRPVDPVDDIITPLLNIPREDAQQRKYFAACFKNRQRALWLLQEAGIPASKIGSYQREQKERVSETPEGVAGVGFKHYYHDLPYANERRIFNENILKLREKQREIAISNQLAREASQPMPNKASSMRSDALLPAPPEPYRPSSQELQYQIAELLRKKHAKYYEKVPKCVYGRLKSNLFANSRPDMRVVSPPPPSHTDDGESMIIDSEEEEEEEEENGYTDEEHDSNDDHEGVVTDDYVNSGDNGGSLLEVAYHDDFIQFSHNPDVFQDADNPDEELLDESDLDGHEQENISGSANAEPDGDPLDMSGPINPILAALAGFPPAQSISSMSSSVSTHALSEQQSTNTNPPTTAYQPYVGSHSTSVFGNPNMTVSQDPSSLYSQSLFGLDASHGLQAQPQEHTLPWRPFQSIPSSNPQSMPGMSSFGVQNATDQLNPSPFQQSLAQSTMQHGFHNNMSSSEEFYTPFHPSLDPFAAPIEPQSDNPAQYLNERPFRQSLAPTTFESGAQHDLSPFNVTTAQSLPFQNSAYQSTGSTPFGPPIHPFSSTGSTQNQDEIENNPFLNTAPNSPYLNAVNAMESQNAIGSNPFLNTTSNVQHLNTLGPQGGLNGSSGSASTPSSGLFPSAARAPPPAPLNLQAGHTNGLSNLHGGNATASSPHVMTPLVNMAGNLTLLSPQAPPQKFAIPEPASQNELQIAIYFPKIIFSEDDILSTPATDCIILGRTIPGSHRLELEKAIFLPAHMFDRIRELSRKGKWRIAESYPCPTEHPASCIHGHSLYSKYANTPDDIQGSHRILYGKVLQAYNLMTQCSDREEELTKRWRVTKGPLLSRDRGSIWEGWGVYVDRPIEMFGAERKGAMQFERTDPPDMNDPEEIYEEMRRKEIDEMIEEDDRRNMLEELVEDQLAMNEEQRMAFVDSMMAAWEEEQARLHGG